jgi:hypothetical protein
MLLLHELHASCSSSCCDVEYNVIITFYTHKKKKKKSHKFTFDSQKCEIRK